MAGHNNATGGATTLRPPYLPKIDAAGGLQPQAANPSAETVCPGLECWFEDADTKER
jgi:hypothetical protein